MNIVNKKKKRLMIQKILTPLTVGVLISGCIGGSPKVSENSKYFSNSSPIAYVALDKDEKVIRVSATSDFSNEDIAEVVIITENGFSPNYDIPDKKIVCIIKGFKKEQNSGICLSIFANTDVTETIVGNTVVTLLTFGTNVIGGLAPYTIRFDYEKFDEVVESSGLLDAQKDVLALYNKLKSIKNKNLLAIEKLNHLQNNRQETVQSIIDTSTIDYQLNDKSGLLFSGFDIKIKCSMTLDEENKFSDNFINFTKNINIDSDLDNISKQIDYKMTEILDLFSMNAVYDSATLKCSNGVGNKKIKRNKYISYNVNIEIQNEQILITDLKNKKEPIVNIVIKSANLTAMYPSSFKLEDKRINADIIVNANDPGMQIFPNIRNNTTEFMSVDSITSYYLDSVNSAYKLGQEIAPESQWLEDNFIHLNNQKHANLSNFKNMTSDKAKKMNINYGYAIKYRHLNTSKEHTLYKRNKISLLDIIKGKI